jgi:predicted HicB family RNase H-like nuclease
MGTPATKKDHTLTVRVPRGLHEQVRSIADRESESYTTVIRRLIRRALAQESAAMEGSR